MEQDESPNEKSCKNEAKQASEDAKNTLIKINSISSQGSKNSLKSIKPRKGKRRVLQPEELEAITVVVAKKTVCESSCID